MESRLRGRKKQLVFGTELVQRLGQAVDCPRRKSDKKRFPAGQSELWAKRDARAKVERSSVPGQSCGEISGAWGEFAVETEMLVHFLKYGGTRVEAIQSVDRG